MRSLLTLLVAYILLVLQSTVLELAPVRMAAPSLGLLVVLYVGVSGKWAISSASIVALCTGYLLDLVSGAPQGVHALVFILVCVFARALSTRVAVQGIVLSAAVAFVASLLASVLVIIVRARVTPEGGYGGLKDAPLEALLTGVAGPIVMGLLRRIDGKLEATRARVGLGRGARSRNIGRAQSPWK
jgi:rod shape-determining protein MreD